MFQNNINGQKAEEILVPNSNFIDFGAYTLLKALLIYGIFRLEQDMISEV